MSEFLLVFRRDYRSPALQPSPEVLPDHLKHWADWFRSLAAQNKLAHPVIRFDADGKIVNSDKVRPGPYLYGKESIGGVMVLDVNSYEEAIELAEGCPVLEFGGTIEIRHALQ